MVMAKDPTQNNSMFTLTAFYSTSNYQDTLEVHI